MYSPLVYSLFLRLQSLTASCARQTVENIVIPMERLKAKRDKEKREVAEGRGKGGGFEARLDSLIVESKVRVSTRVVALPSSHSNSIALVHPGGPPAPGAPVQSHRSDLSAPVSRAALRRTDIIG